jgi:hypothetical protein
MERVEINGFFNDIYNILRESNIGMFLVTFPAGVLFKGRENG